MHEYPLQIRDAMEQMHEFLRSRCTVWLMLGSNFVCPFWGSHLSKKIKDEVIELSQLELARSNWSTSKKILMCWVSDLGLVWAVFGEIPIQIEHLVSANNKSHNQAAGDEEPMWKQSTDVWFCEFETVDVVEKEKEKEIMVVQESGSKVWPSADRKGFGMS